MALIHVTGLADLRLGDGDREHIGRHSRWDLLGVHLSGQSQPVLEGTGPAGAVAQDALALLFLDLSVDHQVLSVGLDVDVLCP